MAQTLVVKSAAFDEGGVIPKDYSGEGRDVSPPLTWSGAPATTKSFALICDDPDAPGGSWVHWVFYNIPVSATALPVAVKGIGVEGHNSWSKSGYGGPMPPPGSGAHRYIFTIYALDAQLSLPAGALKPQVLKAAQGHILAQGQLMGRYKR